MKSCFLVYKLKITKKGFISTNKNGNWRKEFIEANNKMLAYIKQSISVSEKIAYFKKFYLAKNDHIRIIYSLNEPPKVFFCKIIYEVAIEIEYDTSFRNALIKNVYYTNKGGFDGSCKLLFSYNQIKLNNLYKRAAKMQKQAQFVSALELYKSFNLPDKNTINYLEFLTNYANAFAYNGNLKQAIKIFSKVLTKNKTYFYARLSRALFLSFYKIHYKTAYNDLNYVLLTSNVKWKDYGLLIKLYYYRGLIHHFDEKLLNALADYNYVLNIYHNKMRNIYKTIYKNIYHDAIRKSNLILKTIYAGNIEVRINKHMLFFNAGSLAAELKKQKYYGFCNLKAMLETIGAKTKLVIEAIHNNKVDLNSIENDGHTFLSLAIMLENYSLVDYAIKHRACRPLLEDIINGCLIKLRNCSYKNKQHVSEYILQSNKKTKSIY